MGLGIAAIKLNFELWQRGYFENIKSVMEMGSQELYIRLDALEKLIQVANVPNYRRENFKNLANYPHGGRCPAKHFYKMLGVENYSSIDMGGEFEAIPHDLNLPFEDSRLYGSYDLVTDYGTCEHVFNTVEAYRTMHRLLKKQGLMVVMQGVYGSNGFHYYDLSFFEGIAAANGYTIIYSSYYIVPETREDNYHIPLSLELLNVLDWTKVKAIGICYVMQKQNDSSDFHYPYQYHTNREELQGCSLQFLPFPPSRAYLPLARTMESTSTKEVLRHLCGRVPLLKKIGLKLGL